MVIWSCERLELSFKQIAGKLPPPATLTTLEVIWDKASGLEQLGRVNGMGFDATGARRWLTLLSNDLSGILELYMALSLLG